MLLSNIHFDTSLSNDESGSSFNTMFYFASKLHDMNVVSSLSSSSLAGCQIQVDAMLSDRRKVNRIQNIKNENKSKNDGT